MGTDLSLTLLSNDALADYLTTDVLNTLDPQERQFVVEALLTNWCAHHSLTRYAVPQAR